MGFGGEVVGGLRWRSGQRTWSVVTSKVAGPNPSENFPNATRTQSPCEKSKSQRSAESRGPSLGTPVSSHRES
jgi:hypothetical protein